MASTVNDTVADIAERHNIDIDVLLKNIELAGLPQRASEDSISSLDVAVLVSHMKERKASGDSDPRTVTRSGDGSDATVQTAPRRPATIAGGTGTLSRSRGTTLGLQRPATSTVRVEKVRRRRIVRSTPSTTTPTGPQIAPSGEPISPQPVAEPSQAQSTENLEEIRARGPIGTTDPSPSESSSTIDTDSSQLARERERILEQEAQRQAAEKEIRRKQEQRTEESRQRQEAELLRKQEAERARMEKQLAARRVREEEERKSRQIADAAARAQAQANVTQKSGKRRDDKKRTGKSGQREIVDLRDRQPQRVAGRGRGVRQRGPKKRAFEVTKTGGEFLKPVEKVTHDVELHEAITVGELARRMSVKSAEVIKTLMNMGEMVTINQLVDVETATLVVEEMGHRVHIVSGDRMEDELVALQQDEGEMVSRAPVVVVMGHVDHGKTSLLDYVRKTKVASEEHGGITQHIGAYHLETQNGVITFLDTPGHAAFSAMRARGANATDIVVLVCAADDGVMPQTEEAVQHAKAAEVPIIVAVNKIDLPGADSARVRNELNAIGVMPEEWGGDTQFVDVSATTGQGIDDLLTNISLLADVHEFKAYPQGNARGVVIESKVDRGRGPVATMLIQNGTLKRGDIVLTGECYGKVRTLVNDRGETVNEAGPSIPVEMLGLNGAPSAGDDFNVVSDERQARQLADARATKNQQKQTVIRQSSRLESMFANLGKGEKRVLNMVLKADVRGSLEAITQACNDIGNDEVSVQILVSGVGGITESDANMSLAYDAMIFGFNVRLDNAAKRIVEQNGVEVRYYSIIYELLDDIKSMLNDMLVPEVREDIVGTAEVRDVFHSPRFGNIAGCMVVQGAVFRNKKIRVLRDNSVIYEGELESLRRFKDDVSEVRNGFECGIGVRNYNDVREGDRIEVFEAREVARAL